MLDLVAAQAAPLEQIRAYNWSIPITSVSGSSIKTTPFFLETTPLFALHLRHFRHTDLCSEHLSHPFFFIRAIFNDPTHHTTSKFSAAQASASLLLHMREPSFGSSGRPSTGRSDSANFSAIHSTRQTASRSQRSARIPSGVKAKGGGRSCEPRLVAYLAPSPMAHTPSAFNYPITRIHVDTPHLAVPFCTRPRLAITPSWARDIERCMSSLSISQLSSSVPQVLEYYLIARCRHSVTRKLSA